METAEWFLPDQIMIIIASAFTEKWVIFPFPLCQPTAQYRCILESKHLLEEVTEPFHF